MADSNVIRRRKADKYKRKLGLYKPTVWIAKGNYLPIKIIGKYLDRPVRVEEKHLNDGVQLTLKYLNSEEGAENALID